jgi:hypothetical protein
MGVVELSDAQLEELYQWVDSIPLSRRKKNLARDFSDAVLLAEVAHHFFPRLVELHNYDQALRIESKLTNWRTLNRKVLTNLGLELDRDAMAALAHARPGHIESVLWRLKQRITGKLKQKEKAYFKDTGDLPEIAPSEPGQLASDQRVLEEKIRECSEQSEYIAALEAKIAKLDELMRLKDEKIAKLSAPKGKRK